MSAPHYSVITRAENHAVPPEVIFASQMVSEHLVIFSTLYGALCTKQKIAVCFTSSLQWGGRRLPSQTRSRLRVGVPKIDSPPPPPC